MDDRLAPLKNLSDEQLLAEAKRLAASERNATVALIRSLMELDGRRLYLGQGYSSMFAYCTQVLHLSEHAALGRIELARAARRFPAILEALVAGATTVTNARLLAPHLTEENHRDLLQSAQHRSKREVEEIVVSLRPRPDAVSVVRKLPDRKIPDSSDIRPEAPRVNSTPDDAPTAATVDLTTPLRLVAPQAARPVVTPLAPARYKVQFTVSSETHDRVMRAKELMRHTVPNGDVALIFDRALALLIEQLERQKFAATSRPRGTAATRSTTRHVPALVRREVWARDEGRCAFVGAAGRCAEPGFLEFHHVVPYAAGGAAEVANIELRCRAHNAFEATLFFGADVVREVSDAWI